MSTFSTNHDPSQACQHQPPITIKSIILDVITFYVSLFCDSMVIFGGISKLNIKFTWCGWVPWDGCHNSSLCSVWGPRLGRQGQGFCLQMQLNNCEDITNNKFAARDTRHSTYFWTWLQTSQTSFSFSTSKVWREFRGHEVEISSGLLESPLRDCCFWALHSPSCLKWSQTINTWGQDQNTISWMLISEIASHWRSQD